MARPEIALLAIWLMAFICSTQQVHTSGCFSFGRNSRRAIEKIMQKKPGDRNEDEWDRLLKAADKALRGASIMDIESAIDVLRYRGNSNSILYRFYAQELYNITNISKDKCNDDNLPSPGLLLEVTENRYKFPVLYKHVKDSLDHYMDVCGLEDRYKDYIRWKSPNNAADSGVTTKKQPTLAERMLGELCPRDRRTYHYFRDSCTAIRLMRDPDLTSKTRCNDNKFIAKLVTGLQIEDADWARDYVDYVLDDSRKTCGHDDRLILIADGIPRKDHHGRLAKILAGRLSEVIVSDRIKALSNA